MKTVVVTAALVLSAGAVAACPAEKTRDASVTVKPAVVAKASTAPVERVQFVAQADKASEKQTAKR